MLTKTILQLLLTVTNQPLPEFIDDCGKLFDQDQYKEVIKTCAIREAESQELQFMVSLSRFFIEISFQRLDFLFYNGSPMYEIARGEKLFKNGEEKALKFHHERLQKFAEMGYPFAQLVVAKIFYINETIIRRMDGKVTLPNYLKHHTQRMKQGYISHLESYIQANPDDVEVLFLLGKQGLKAENAGFRPDKRYFSIVNKQYYSYLIKSFELGHPEAQVLIDGVDNWQQHLKTENKEAEGNDVESIYAIGLRHYYNKKNQPNRLELAIEYFNKAADLKHILSLVMLKTIYSRDLPDGDKYLETVKSLVSLNHTDSMIVLGDYYLCREEKLKAKKLYEKAKSLGSPLAQVAIEDLEIDGEPSSGCYR
jgi:tetratricopeptide (TPR) repeat protein